MLIYQLLIGLIGFIVGSILLTLISLLIFGKRKTISKKVIIVISSAVSLLYTIGYCVLLFAIEGEGQGTGLDQGFGEFISVVPLFLTIYVFFLLFVALPVSLLAVGFYPSFAARKKP